jgi:hypothetical protein
MLCTPVTIRCRNASILFIELHTLHTSCRAIHARTPRTIGVVACCCCTAHTLTKTTPVACVTATTHDGTPWRVPWLLKPLRVAPARLPPPTQVFWRVFQIHPLPGPSALAQLAGHAWHTLQCTGVVAQHLPFFTTIPAKHLMQTVLTENCCTPPTAHLFKVGLSLCSVLLLVLAIVWFRFRNPKVRGGISIPILVEFRRHSWYYE